MADIPHAVLSDHFHERMEGRRLRSAVFMTFKFDPAFFEEEVLPVFLDIPLSHAMKIRLVQLEDTLRDLPGNIAVYYDAHGIVCNSTSAKLDVRRVPICLRTGIFHPKNVFLLVEADQPDEDGVRARSLIVATMSANLTRAGWWEQLEACHVEEIGEADKTCLKDELARFLRSIRDKAAPGTDQSALEDILGFLKATEQRQQKSSDGLLEPQFFRGGQSVTDFLWSNVADLAGSYLEIISPYFDNAESCRPLRELVDRFKPKEVRVFVPRNAAGEGALREELYHDVRSLENVYWGKLPKEMLRLGKSEDAGERSVHAKVYRFFSQNPKRELLFITSANLTTAAHQEKGGNMETGILVETKPPRRPDFWLMRDDKKPAAFQDCTGEDVATSGGTRLALKFHWDTKVASAYWESGEQSPSLRLEARGREFKVGPIAGCAWVQLDSNIAAVLEEILRETSFIHVHGDGPEPALLLVQEEGMSHKPSILMSLSAADILRYWAMLTPEQRAAFIESRAAELGLGGEDDLVVRARLLLGEDTLFDRFAGFFHAFGCLERSVREALGEPEQQRRPGSNGASNEREATYRLFGKKYDSLGSLLERVLKKEDSIDDIDRYVIILCARQLCKEIAGDYPAFWKTHGSDADEIESRFTETKTVRDRLVEQDPENMAPFLEWFEKWFLRRAEAAEVEHD